MIYTGKKVYDPLTNTYSTGYWIKDSQGCWYPVWRKRGVDIDTEVSLYCENLCDTNSFNDDRFGG